MVKELSADASLRQLELEVTSSQIPAITMYKSFGFEVAEEKKGAVHVGPAIYDELVMRKQLGSQNDIPVSAIISS